MEEEKLVQDLVPPKTAFKEVVLPVLIILLIILAGGATGWFLSRSGPGLGLSKVTELTGGVEQVSGSKQMGIKDKETFPDLAEGRLEANDDPAIPEGSHRLVRPGGLNKTAYLTSSAVDLDIFLGKCVLVWGETFASQKVGWLMDIGYIELLDNCPEGL